MKRNLLYTLLLTLFIPCAAPAQTTRTLLQGELLHGKVQKITEMQYRVKPATEQSTVFNSPITDTTFYDENGNTTERHTQVNGVVYTYVYTTEFDKQGRKIKTSCDKAILIYDKHGNVIKFDQYDKAGGNLMAEDRRKYDSNNNMIEYTYYTSKGNLAFKRTYQYNDKNELIEEKDYTKDGSLSYTTYYTYNTFDENDNWTQRTSSEKFESGAQVKPLIIIRQITYYQ